jgi:hypothetical protein
VCHSGLLRANATASGGTPSGSSSPTTGSYPDNRKVRFRWKNYRDGSQQKTITLDGDEYIRRFLIHVLPDGFHRIRHYGFLGDCHRGRKLAHCRELLGMAPPGVAQVRRSLDLIGETMAMLEATTVSPPASAALKVARLLGELETYVHGQRVELDIVNQSHLAHLMHLRGHHFQVVALDGTPVAGAMRATVFVPFNGAVSLNRWGNRASARPKIRCRS